MIHVDNKGGDFICRAAHDSELPPRNEKNGVQMLKRFCARHQEGEGVGGGGDNVAFTFR